MILICSSIQRKFTDHDSSTSGKSKGMEVIKEGSSPRAGYQNESSSSDSDFNLNSSMPHHSDIDISGPHTGNNGEFHCHDGLMTDLLTICRIISFGSLFCYIELLINASVRLMSFKETGKEF
jgi:hypothetical protein